MADELRHLARHAKKNLVRDWNTGVAQQQQSKQQSELHHQSDDTCGSDGEDDLALAADHPLEPNDRLLQWLRQDLEPSPVISSQWEAQFRDHSQPNDEEDLEAEAIPLTSGQVKHAYRTRARRQEVQDTKRAVEMKVKREVLLGLQHDRAQAIAVSRPKASQNKNTQSESLTAKSTRTARVPPPPQPQVKAHDESLANNAEQEQTQDSRVLELRNLSPSRMCMDSEYRNETLARIRKQLISGHDVLLVSDCASTEGSALSDMKIMMQQLCAQSLMYCVREQEVVPRVDLSPQRVELLLRTRIPPS